MKYQTPKSQRSTVPRLIGGPVRSGSPKVCIWRAREFPALKINPKITWVICVDTEGNTKIEVIFERGQEPHQPQARPTQ